MDLEHTNLGRHCEVEDCHQRDFLPFTCDVCQKKLCLSHRGYVAHDCSGGGRATKDMTSIDCPLCGLGVKFPKAANVDTVWEEHYLTTCTQQQKPQEHKYCHEVSCRIQLGPSNRYNCTKCKQDVCLSHRNAEDHHCGGMRGAILSKLPQKPQPQPKAQLTTSKSASNNNNSKAVVGSKPSAIATTSSNSAELRCPFCNEKQSDVSFLQIHVNTYHAESPSTSSRQPSTPQRMTSTPSNNNNNNNNNARAREVCPLCQARFEDPIQLVTHYELAHPPTTSNTATSNNNNNNTECVMG